MHPVGLESMLKRNVRMRKEYLYRKSLEGKARDEYEKKQLIRKALEGKFESMFTPQ